MPSSASAPVADLRLDAGIEDLIASSPEVQSDMRRRAASVAAASRRVVHVDPKRNVAKDGPHLRDTIYAKQVGNEWRVGSDAEYAEAEEFGDSPKHGGQHSFLRAVIHVAGR